VAARVRILRVGVDVALDEGSQGRLAEVAVVIQAGVDEQVDVVSGEAGPIEACRGRGVGQLASTSLS
jgi:hypothetical protein